MITTKEILQALYTVKTYCEERKCEDCIMFCGCECDIYEKNPCGLDITKENSYITYKTYIDTYLNI